MRDEDRAQRNRRREDVKGRNGRGGSKVKGKKVNFRIQIEEGKKGIGERRGIRDR